MTVGRFCWLGEGRERWHGSAKVIPFLKALRNACHWLPTCSAVRTVLVRSNGFALLDRLHVAVVLLQGLLRAACLLTVAGFNGADPATGRDA